MATSFVDSYGGRVPLSMPSAAAMTKPHADLDLADALTKVSPKAQAKAKATATDFEAMFLNSMFAQMTSGVKGDGPFGDTPSTGVWRSMLMEQYSKNFAKAGGVGLSNDVFRTLILQQAKSSGSGADNGKAQTQAFTSRESVPTRADRSYEMTAPGQAKPTTYAATASAAEARALADEMIGVMSELLTVIEQETELVRAGKLREGMAFGPRKTELSRHYVTTVGRLKASQPFMKQTTPELLGTLHRHHDTFRAMLQVNLTVLATAHAISEKIVRGVNAEIQRRNVPNTYTAGGRRAAPGARHLTPLAVSRTL